MRRFTVTLAICAGLLPLASCSDSTPVAMPDVVGKRLDIALSDVERAGFDDEVEVLGGGAFGIVDESNWTVCSQEPEVGSQLDQAPRISVDRSCDNADAVEAEASTDAGDAPSADEETVAITKKPKPRKKRKQAPVPDTFVMPAMVGMNLQKAQNLLQARGSFLLTQTDGTGEDRFQMVDYNWKVCGQNPPAGTKTDIATLVELITVKVYEAC